MLNKDNFNDLINYVLVIGLFILAGIILYPIAHAIIYGILLAYTSYPMYRWILKRTKSSLLSALFVCIGFFTIIITASILILGAVFRQAINFYMFLQKTDIVGMIRKIIPLLFSSSDVSENILSSLNNYISNFLANYISKFTMYISNLPSLVIQIAVVIFTFFFALKDGEKAIEYIKSLSHLKKETQEKFFRKFREITNSVLLGQIVIGFVQGIFAGIGYFVFGVPNATLLALATMITAMIPLIGAWIIWVPVDIYLFAIGRTTSAFGLLIYGLFFISIIDNILRSLIVSRKTKINTGIITIGMLGGLFVFGFLGLIIGPLILAYVLLVIELYRKNTFDEDLIFKKGE